MINPGNMSKNLKLIIQMSIIFFHFHNEFNYEDVDKLNIN